MSGPALQKFVVQYANGDRVFSEGEPGATMYIVQSGQVRLFRNDDDQECVLGLMERGDFFGEMSILEGLPRGNNAEVVEAAELIEINSTTFDRMIRGNIEIAIRLLRKLSMRLREAERKAARLEANEGGPSQAARSSPVPAGVDAARLDSGLRLELADEGLAFALNSDETLIGRYDPVTEQKPDIDLTDADLKRTVSRRHARIVKDEDGYHVIEEVGALNGTFVNGTKLVPGQAHAIKDGDSIGLGMVQLVFRT